MFCGNGTVDKSLERSFGVHCHLQKQEKMQLRGHVCFWVIYISKGYNYQVLLNNILLTSLAGSQKTDDSKVFITEMTGML